MTVHISVKHRKQTMRYADNPFDADRVLPINKKWIQISRLSHPTSKNKGTHITTYKQANHKQFVMQSIDAIKKIFELKIAGVKAFRVLMWLFQSKTISNNPVLLNKFVLEDYLKSQEEKITLSHSTFLRGLVELEKANIIARSFHRGWYFINPNFVFNGNDIVFSLHISCSERNRDPLIEERKSEVFCLLI
uniref:Rep related protein n=1 Tax=Bartonella schoenbuchensis TaxID=165694 RepID=A0A024LQD5_9HYPH|nr:Rep related protein [Bartonella schoenbuchensis]CDP79662.1 Rep related protein [Bartonella schoenbuchensis]